MSSARYSGAALKKLANVKGVKVTRTQTAAMAVRAIERKYGKVVDNATYYYRGKGKQNGGWTKYSPSADAKKRPRLGVRNKKEAKQFGDVTKPVRNSRGKVVGKIVGKNSHKADTKRQNKKYKDPATGRKYRGQV